VLLCEVTSALPVQLFWVALLPRLRVRVRMTTLLAE